MHEQKFKDPFSSTCQINTERIVLDFESEVLFPLGVTFFSKFYNPNLHNIARSDSLGFKTKNPSVCHLGGKNTMTFSHKLTQCDTVVQSMADPGLPGEEEPTAKEGVPTYYFAIFS